MHPTGSSSTALSTEIGSSANILTQSRFHNSLDGDMNNSTNSLGDFVEHHYKRKIRWHPDDSQNQNSYHSSNKSLQSLQQSSRRSLRQIPSFRSTGSNASVTRRNSLLSSTQQSSFKKPDLPSPASPELSGGNSWLLRLRLWCKAIVEKPAVQLAVIYLIIVNALIMGVATFDFVTEDQETSHAFELLDKVFLSIFTVEIALQLVYRGVHLFFDAWLVFDLFIVVVSWFDGAEEMQVVRAFRIFRALRLVTRIGPLRELIMALGNVMPRMYAIALLLALVFYIYAVLFTYLFRDLTLSGEYFGSLSQSLFTCMELMTLEWAGIAREVMAKKQWAWAPILSFVSITGFIVFNLVIAVVCDSVSIVDDQIRAEQEAEEQAERERQGLPEELTEEEILIQHLYHANVRIAQLTQQVSVLKSSHEQMTQALAVFCQEYRTDREIDDEDSSSDVDSEGTDRPAPVNGVGSDPVWSHASRLLESRASSSSSDDDGESIDFRNEAFVDCVSNMEPEEEPVESPSTTNVQSSACDRSEHTEVSTTSSVRRYFT